jgi:hypothetical protein
MSDPPYIFRAGCLSTCTTSDLLGQSIKSVTVTDWCLQCSLVEVIFNAVILTLNFFNIWEELKIRIPQIYAVCKKKSYSDKTWLQKKLWSWQGQHFCYNHGSFVIPLIVIMLLTMSSCFTEKYQVSSMWHTWSSYFEKQDTRIK